MLQGAQTWQRGGDTVQLSSELTLTPPAQQFSWGIYQYGGMADGDSVTNVTVELASPGPENYYLGWSDYNSRSWVWQRRSDKISSTSVDDVFEPPAGVNPISYNGNVHVAVVAWDAAPATIYSVTLTAELNEVPVVIFFGDPYIGNQDLTVSFDAMLCFVRGGGTITEFEWDWDGPAGGWNFESTGAIDGAVHTYTEPGVYQPVLRITGDQGGQDHGATWITVSGWIHTWGGSGHDKGLAVAVDEAGSIYVAGTENSFSGGGDDLLLLKYDSAHNLIWRRVFGEEQYKHERPYGIVAAGGSVYVTGVTPGFGAESASVLLVKYSGGGTLEWAQTWGGSDYDSGRGIALSEDGHLYVAGHTMSFGNEAEALMLKYDLDGNLIWAYRWGGPASEYITGVAVHDNDTIYMTGETRSFGNAAGDVLLLKWDGAGEVAWGRSWGGTHWEGANAVCLDQLGNIYLAGGTATYASGTPPNVLALKYTPAGTLEWVKTWGAGEPEVATVAVADGMVIERIYIGGRITISGIMYPLLLLFNTDGHLYWHRTWLPGSTDDDGFYGMALGPGGVLLMTGLSERAEGVWDDANQQLVAAHLDPGQAINMPSTEASGTVTILTEYLAEAPPGTIDTGGGGADALLLEFYPGGL